MGRSTFSIGGELTVGRIGFGAMHLPTAPESRAAAIAVARRAVELGVTLIDTAFLYGGGANEELLVEALHPYPNGLLVTTKIGVAPPGPGRDWALDGRPEQLRAQIDQALRRLRMERLDLLQLHRIDPAVPLADQLGALREQQIAGKIGHLGLSEVTAAELTEARQIIEVASVQNRYNLRDREHEDVLAACAEAGIAFLPWRPVHPSVTAASVVGAGVGSVAPGSPGSGSPGPVAAVADELGATPAQVALAWLLARSPVVLPIPGTSSLTHLEQNVAAADLTLSPEQWQRLDRRPPVPGHGPPS